VRATICQLRDDDAGLESDWNGLVAHVREQASALVLLPEMPFYPWPFVEQNPSAEVWRQACEAHERWMGRLEELAPAVVLGTRPIDQDGLRQNEAFVWDAASGYKAVHRKYYLPNEPGFWESSWYSRGGGAFEACDVAGVRVGVLVCTELWFLERARAYGREGAQVIVCPRATPRYSAEKWLVGGRAASIVSGAYCLSSNRAGPGPGGEGTAWAGVGWVVEPDSGRLVGTTHERSPFLTVEIDAALADAAKSTYPRYIAE